jgi:two-component system, LytTR family, response regulator
MERLINVMIIDDNDTSINELEKSLLSVEQISIIGKASNAKKAKALIMEKRPSLIFLDIELPDENGMEMLKSIKDSVTWPMQVIFYTAHNKYLLDAIRVSAFDYLLKPYDENEFRSVIKRYLNYLDKNSNTSFNQELFKILPDNNMFMVTTVNGFQFLRIEQIGLFTYQNERKVWSILLNNNSIVYLRRNISAKDLLKHSDVFVQINRENIINIHYLSFINDKECVLFPPFDQIKGLNASSGALKLIQERFSQL